MNSPGREGGNRASQLRESIDIVNRVIELAAEHDAVRQRLKAALAKLDAARGPVYQFPVGVSLVRSPARPFAVLSKISTVANCPVCHSADLSASDTIAVCNDCEWISAAATRSLARAFGTLTPGWASMS